MKTSRVLLIQSKGPGRPTIWMIEGKGPIALAVGAGGGLFGHCYSPLSFLLFLPFSGRRPDID